MQDDVPLSPRESLEHAPHFEKASGAIEHFSRHETARLHGTLLRQFGPAHLTLIEDVTQEAMLRALRSWSIGGFPANPAAWITRVAVNLARDALRHQRMSQSKQDSIVTHFETQHSAPVVQTADDAEIRDNSLRMMFVCCHPLLSADAQVVLALKVLCGFTTAEIARTFLSQEAAIEKQLTRTKQRIKAAKIGFDLPDGEELSPRLEGVLAALYLLFNEGYKASAGDVLIREELCKEAIRLTRVLVEHPVGNTPSGHALLAFMLLTSARFPTRVDDRGDLLRLSEQDRSKWDIAGIEEGLQHLAKAAEGSAVTEYHVQAGIAACHCTAPDYASTDWSRILRHYDQLYRLKPSPIVALNRAVALAHVLGPQAALDNIAAIPDRDRLDSHYLLHAVEGELHWQMANHQAAAERFRRAFQLAKVGAEQNYLTRRLRQTALTPQTTTCDPIDDADSAH